MNTNTEARLLFRTATFDDARAVWDFLQPFVEQKLLLSRTLSEIEHLTKHAFVARDGQQVVGFAAVEIYSRKLAEIQCLAVAPTHQRLGIGKRLVQMCVQRARELNILELMAISASDEFLRSCGFDYSLPMQKRALFAQPMQMPEFGSSNESDSDKGE